MVEVIWRLPGKAAKELRRKSAEIIVRVLGGDLTLCEEIEERYAHLQQTSEGRAFQNIVLNDTDNKKKRRLGGEIMEHATEHDYQRYVKMKVDSFHEQEKMEIEREKIESVKQTMQSEYDIVMFMKDAFELNDKLDFRSKLELGDQLLDIQRRTFRRINQIGSGGDNGNAQVAVSEVSVDPGHSVPTPECVAQVRGEEISIAQVSSRMNIRLGNRAGLAGKKLKALYAERYGQSAANSLPKRTTTFMGKPFDENM